MTDYIVTTFDRRRVDRETGVAIGTRVLMEQTFDDALDAARTFAAAADHGHRVYLHAKTGGHTTLVAASDDSGLSAFGKPATMNEAAGTDPATTGADRAPGR